MPDEFDFDSLPEETKKFVREEFGIENLKIIEAEELVIGGPGKNGSYSISVYEKSNIIIFRIDETQRQLLVNALKQFD